MSYTERSRTLPYYSYYGSTWSGTQCGPTYQYGPVEMLAGDEYVKSYRGPKEYITFRGKKVKKYHAFTRYKWECSQGTFMACDERTPGVFNSVNYDYLPTGFLQRQNDENLYPGYPELLTYNQMNSYGSTLRDHVISDMYGKANSPRFQTAVFLAELDETLVGMRKLLVGAAKTLWKGENAWKHVKHFSLNSEELWLWYRYALMPAILECNDLMEALKPPVEETTASDGDAFEDTLSGEIASNGWFGYWDTSVSWKGDLKFRCGGRLDIESKFDLFTWGLGPADIVAAAWERIPFSFIFDWFVKLGDWLAAIRPTDITYAQSYASFALDIMYTFESEEWVNLTGEPCYVHVFLQDRIIDIEPPKLPLIDKRWANITRSVDLIALTTGILKGILSKRRH